MWYGRLQIEYEDHYDSIESYWEYGSKEKVLNQSLLDAKTINTKNPILIEIWESDDGMSGDTWFGYRSDENYEEFIID